MNKILACLLSAIVMTACSDSTDLKEKTSDLSFEFDGTKYFHRWSQNQQHEFTPVSQEDLSKWQDMVTINLYPPVTDGEGLATLANTVLGNYKAAQAMIAKTDSFLSTDSKTAEYFILAVFPQPEFIEVAFTRLKMSDGMGISMVYSHRMYGQNIEESMHLWLKNHAQTTQQTLMEWDAPFNLNKL